MQDETGRRELFIPFGASAYVLRYMQEDKDTVVVVRVWHSREIRSN
jgi:plasmid stabilization system protein ParE